MSMHIARPEQLSGAGYFDLKLTYEIGPMQLKDLIGSKEEWQVLDVRSTDAYQHGHIPGAVNVPFDERDRHQGVQYIYHLNKNLPVVVYSYGLYCTVAYQAAYLLARNGYRVKTLIGGWEGWMHYHLPVEPVGQEHLSPFEAIDGI